MGQSPKKARSSCDLPKPAATRAPAVLLNLWIQMLSLYVHRQSLTTGESLLAVVDQHVVASEGASTAWVRSGNRCRSIATRATRCHRQHPVFR